MLLSLSYAPFLPALRSMSTSTTNVELAKTAVLPALSGTAHDELLSATSASGSTGNSLGLTVRPSEPAMGR